MTTRFYPYDDIPHGADPRHFDQIEKKSWCLCHEWHWPHSIIKHTLNSGYQHLECRSFTAATAVEEGRASCTEHVGHQGDHSCTIGNDVEGWHKRTWKPAIR